jgi:hypothetical protein
MPVPWMFTKRRYVFDVTHMVMIILEVASTLNSIGLVLFKMELHDLAMQSFIEGLRIRGGLLTIETLLLFS